MPLFIIGAGVRSLQPVFPDCMRREIPFLTAAAVVVAIEEKQRRTIKYKDRKFLF